MCVVTLGRNGSPLVELDSAQSTIQTRPKREQKGVLTLIRSLGKERKKEKEKEKEKREKRKKPREDQRDRPTTRSNHTPINHHPSYHTVTGKALFRSVLSILKAAPELHSGSIQQISSLSPHTHSHSHSPPSPQVKLRGSTVQSN